MSVADLEAWGREHGAFPDECAVLLRTGWHRRWGTAEFLNLDENGVPRHPGFSVEAARWLIERGALARRGALGTDAFSPDVGADRDFAVSKLLLREQRISLEALTGLDALPPRGFFVVVGGFVTRGGFGSPATVYALVPEDLGRPTG